MGQCGLTRIIQQPDGNALFLCDQRRMRDNFESGGFGFPDRRQVTKVPALDIFSFWRVGLGGGDCRLSGAKLCDQSRHIPALPQ